jgi:hypothetical protein
MSWSRAIAAGIAVACVVTAGSAAAQQPQPMFVPVPVSPEPPLGPEPGTYVPRTIFGVALMAGGGGGEYTNSAVRPSTGATGNWNVRGIIGTRTYVGIEADYVGAAGSISSFGLGTSNTLVRNGFEGLLRVQFPGSVGMALVEPYAFGGFGWDHYSLSSTPIATASINATDEVLTVPVGGGFAAGYKGLIADVRFTYRPTYNETLFGADSSAGLTNWNASGSLGYEF